MYQLYQKLINHRIIRYGISGVATLLVNLGAIWLLIHYADMDQNDLTKNIAHLVGTEISILFSFHAHNYWTWSNREKGNYLHRIIQFHMLTFVTIVLRQIGFWALNEFEYHWLVSTLVPLAIAILINFLGYDKMIFKNGVIDHEDSI